MPDAPSAAPPGTAAEDLPHLQPETIILDQDQNTLAVIDGVLLRPPTGAIVELGKPNRDAVVREVRLRLFPQHASVLVRVFDRGEIIPPTSDGGRTRYRG